MTKNLKTLETETNLLVESQSSNLLVVMTKELLFSSKSSGYWDNCINAIIILDNDHCFKEDPLYGQMLKRMWNGELSIEDQKRINTRVIGYDGLTIPDKLEGES